MHVRRECNVVEKCVKLPNNLLRDRNFLNWLFGKAALFPVSYLKLKFLKSVSYRLLFIKNISESVFFTLHLARLVTQNAFKCFLRRSECCKRGLVCLLNSRFIASSTDEPFSALIFRWHFSFYVPYICCSLLNLNYSEEE